MVIPLHIEEQIKRIKQAYASWTYQFNATWLLASFLRKNYQNTEAWEKPIPMPLPAASEKMVPHRSAKELVYIAEHRDAEITMTHPIMIFAFLEALAEDVCFALRRETRSFTKIEKLVEFLKDERFLLPEEEAMLRMAKISRDAFAHCGDRIPNWWMDVYKKYGHTIKQFNPEEPKDKLSPIVNFPVVRSWNDLLLTITDRIEKRLQNSTV